MIKTLQSIPAISYATTIAMLEAKLQTLEIAYLEAMKAGETSAITSLESAIQNYRQMLSVELALLEGND